MNRFLSLFVLLSFVVPTWADEPTKPNVLVILTDDQGWGDLSLHGNTNLKTPQIDSLSKEGAAFDRFFVQPVCSPTRAEFLTGRYHPRCGVRDVSTGGERLNLDEKTIADSFRQAGYATSCFGKWHNGSQYPYHPNGRGFAEYYGFTSGHWGDYFNPPLEQNGQAITGKGFLADDLTDQALGFIDKHKAKPFFCYLAYNTPHSPMQVPDAYWKRFQSLELKMRPSNQQKEDVHHTRAALAMCENLDWNIGRLLQRLDEQKLKENTIIVYFHDNGPNGGRWNGGMKGRKGSTDEGGVRSPLLIRWPAKIRAGTSIQPIAAAIDLLPTLTDLANVKQVGEKPLDGQSLAPLLLGTKTDWPDRVLFQTWNGRVSARNQKYRLDADGKLFDMQADPGQQNDVSATQTEQVQTLQKAVAEWRKNVLVNITKKDDRPFPVGYKELPITTLPARDGIPHGTVVRSARAPNCSYFTNWTKPEDRITWEVEVATEGLYSIEILHTCAQENIGTEIEFRLGESRLSKKVDTAYDPPAHGQENDRVPRVGESLVKDFKPLRLGEVKLTKGRGQIILQAPQIPGKAAIEVRSLVLTLLK